MKLVKYLVVCILVSALFSCADIKNSVAPVSQEELNQTNQIVKSSAHRQVDSDVSDKKGGFCVWLMPDKQNYGYLEDIIKGIANIQKTPVFKPHLTLFCGNNEDLSLVEKQFRTIFNGEKQFSIDIGKPQMADDFLLKMNLPVTADENLQGLHDQAQELDSDSDYTFSPHIALFYGDKIPSAIIDVPKEYLYKIDKPQITSIALIKKGCSFRNYRCVETRKIVSEIKLEK